NLRKLVSSLKLKFVTDLPLSPTSRKVKLHMDCTTRWTTTTKMVQEFLEHRTGLVEMKGTAESVLRDLRIRPRLKKAERERSQRCGELLDVLTDLLQEASIEVVG